MLMYWFISFFLLKLKTNILSSAAVCLSGWSWGVWLLWFDMVTELPNRRWKWRFDIRGTNTLDLLSAIFIMNCYWLQQNMKFKVTVCSAKVCPLLISHFVSFRFFDLFEKCEGYKSGKLKLKKPKQLQVNTFWFSNELWIFTTHI